MCLHAFYKEIKCEIKIQRIFLQQNRKLTYLHEMLCSFIMKKIIFLTCISVIMLKYKTMMNRSIVVSIDLVIFAVFQYSKKK